MREIKFINILRVDDELKEKIRQWRNREEIRKFMLTQHIISKKEHFKWIESLKNRKDWKFWIVFIDGAPVGSIYFQNIDYKNFSSEWGFYIGESSYRGKGLSKDILFKFLEMFFEKMEFEDLHIKVLSSNVIALNLYKKFKFKEVDRVPFKNKEKIVLLKFSKKDWLKWKEELKNECFYTNSK